MNENDENNIPVNSLEETIDETPPSNEVEPEKEPPGKLKKFFQKAFIWLIVIVVAFAAGFLLDHFLRYRPLSEKYVAVQSDLEQAKADVNELQMEKNRLLFDIGVAYDDNSTLQKELDETNARLKFYQVLVDVNKARIELFLEDTDAAQAALTDTKERLEELLPVITEIDPELALSLPRRLDLIISGLERDPEAGKIDLELFTKDLLILELDLF